MTHHLLKLLKLVVLCPKQVNQLILDCEVDDLSSDYHQQNQVLEDIHEVILFLTVEFRQIYLCKVLLLLDKVVLKTDIPAERVSKLDQKSSVAFSLDEIRSL